MNDADLGNDDDGNDTVMPLRRLVDRSASALRRLTGRAAVPPSTPSDGNGKQGNEGALDGGEGGGEDGGDVELDGEGRWWSAVEGVLALRCELAEHGHRLRSRAVLRVAGGEDDDGGDDDDDGAGDGTRARARATGDHVDWRTYDALARYVDDAQATLDGCVDEWEAEDGVAKNTTTDEGVGSTIDVVADDGGSGAAATRAERHVPRRRCSTISSSPRIVRLANRLDLTRPELWALHFVVLHHVGHHFPPVTSDSKSPYWDRGMLRNLAVCCPTMSTAGMVLTFFGPERHHVKQGLVKIDDDPIMSDTANMNFSVGRPVLSAIVGAPLSEEEELTIDGTALADVLEDERRRVAAELTGRGGDDDAAMTMDEELEDGDLSREGAKAATTPDSDDGAGDDSDGDIVHVLDRLVLEEKKREEQRQRRPRNEEEEEDGGDEEVSIDGDVIGQGQQHPPSSSAASSSAVALPMSTLTPYDNDLDYLNDWFAVVAARLERMYADLEDESYFRMESSKNKAQILREKAARIKTALARVERRSDLTMSLYDETAAGGGGGGDDEGDDDPTTSAAAFCPRLERLARLRKLSSFEKLVIVTLIGGVLSPEIVRILYRQHKVSASFTVGELLWLHLPELKDQIDHRHYFYKTGTLVKERILSVDEKGMGGKQDLVGCSVEIDRRVLDYCVALDTEIDCLVDGTVLTTPQTTMDQVVLPPETKRTILRTVNNAERLEPLKRRLGLDHVLEYGRGTVVLLHGRSGVGKTMLACAVANHLGKKLLLATLVSSADTLVDDLRLVFREARIQNALVFLDECEGLFESRSLRGQYAVNRVLTEIERYDGLMILATNRPDDLDDALHRRIALSVELPLPDAELRRRIWVAHVPPNVIVDPDVNFGTLATEFELSGGFIKNALLMALLNNDEADEECDDDDTKEGRGDESIDGGATGGKKHCYRLSQRALEDACLTQMQGQFELDSQYECVLPHQLGERFDTIACLRINPEATATFRRAVAEYKARHLLKNRPSFSSSTSTSPPSCVSVLVLGPSQSGKTTSIRALAAECHRPLVTMSVSDLVAHYHQNGHSRGQKRTSVFHDVFHSGALVHVDLQVGDSYYEGGSDTLKSSALQSLLRVLRTFQGVLAVELTCSTLQQRQWMGGGDGGRGRGEVESWFGRLVHAIGYVVRLGPTSPTAAASLWRLCVDDDDDRIDKGELGRRFPHLSIGQMEQVIRHARVSVISSSSNDSSSAKRDCTTEDIVRAALWLEEKYRVAGAQKNGLSMYC